MPQADVSEKLQEQHEAKVKALVSAVRARPEGKKISIRKNTPSHQIHNDSWKDKCHRVDVSQFNEIIGFKTITNMDGEKTMVAICEGQVQMGQLAKACLARGYVAKLVPEYMDFTVAGLLNGEGIQTSAYKYGVFSHTVHKLEVVLGNGDVVESTKTIHPDLYTNMSESYGTLGIVVLAEVELVPALPFVQSNYTLHHDRAQFVQEFDKKCRTQKGDYLEGLVLAKGAYLIIESHFVNTSSGLDVFEPCPEDLERGEMYYYQYIRKVVVSSDKTHVARQKDAIPTFEFLFRSMRGAWWMMEDHINVPFFTAYPFMRRIVDKKAKEEIAANGGFRATGHLCLEDTQRCTVLQDMGILLSRLHEGIEWVETNLGVYPLWICPVNQKRSAKITREYLENTPHQRLKPGNPENEWVVDIGIYGEPTVQPFKHRKTLKTLQEFVDAPSAWGVSYEDSTHIRERYHKIRERYHALDAFPGVEEKVTFKKKSAADDNVDEGPIPFWRFVRDYGPYWYLKWGGSLTLWYTGWYHVLCWLLREVFLPVRLIADKDTANVTVPLVVVSTMVMLTFGFLKLMAYDP